MNTDLRQWLRGKDSAYSAGDSGDRFQSPGWEDPLEEDMAIPPVFLPGKARGQRSLADYSPLGHTESDTTEATEDARNMKISNANWKWAKVLERYFIKEDERTANKHMKRCSISLAVREMQIKATMTYHYQMELELEPSLTVM